jgi:phage terminase large subunit-like protein
MAPRNDADLSIAQRIARLSLAGQARLRSCFTAEQWSLMDGCWAIQARGNQLAPDGKWRLWLILAGRGFGKTRAGAEWVDAYARANMNARIALIGATMRDVRNVMVEGESGILNLGSTAALPLWNPSLSKLIWRESGSIATCYSAAEPEALRGPQHHAAWADEIGRWGLDQDGAGALAAWTNLQLGLRLGKFPQVVATTTPRATPLLRQLLGKRPAKTTVITGGPTRANAEHLPSAWLAAMSHDYAGTRLARQELEGDFIDDVPGALFSRALIDRCRMDRAEVDESALVRVVIGVDPPAGSAGDACGIIVAAMTGDGVALVLDDASVERAGPDIWAQAVAAAAARWRADRVIAEANNGGAMVASVLRAAGEHLPIKLVHATRDKAARAEPLLVHYQRGRVRHVGALGRLEDELCGLLAAGKYAGPGRSPDRADACVWALTALLAGRGDERGPGIRGL